MLSFPETFKLFSDFRKYFHRRIEYLKVEETHKDHQGPTPGSAQDYPKTHTMRRKRRRLSRQAFAADSPVLPKISGQGFFENRMDLVLMPGEGIATWDKI